jgi:hypothetical protein
MKMIRSRALVGAGAVLIVAALVSPLISSAFTQESDKTEQVEATPTKSYAKVVGVWTYDCEFPVQRPEQIMLTCADGGMIVTNIKWQTWDTRGATGTGIYSQNMCDPSCAEGKRVDVPVIVNLSELFEYKGKNVLRTLDIEAVSERELPNGNTRISWDVSEFAVRMNWDISLP